MLLPFRITRNLHPFLSIFVCCALLASCSSAPALRIGFTGELSGQNAALGVQGRNGAQLAVEAINRAGGVQGRSMELITKDDTASKDMLLEANQTLINSGVVALTGHLTSWEAATALPVIDQHKIVLISPTASSTNFSGKDDYFFRLIPTNDVQASALAAYTFQTLGIRSAAIIHDDDNASYTQTLATVFRERFSGLGGAITSEISFSSRSAPDFSALAESLSHEAPQAVLIIAASMDAAMIAQQIRLSGWQPQLLSANWAYTPDLLQNGGMAVDGMILSSYFDANCQDPDFLQFQESYLRAFNEKPTFAATLSYETIQVLAAALEQTGGKSEGLPGALRQTKNFKGLCDRITIDSFGDAHRTLYIIQVRDRAFTVLKTLPPERQP